MSTTDDWLDQARRLVAGLGQSLAAASAPPAADGDAHDAAHAHGTDCRWCPLCQAVAVLRGERPELTAALADALGAAAAALRTLAEPPPSPDRPAGVQPDGATGDRPGDGPAGPAVQHIEIA